MIWILQRVIIEGKFAFQCCEVLEGQEASGERGFSSIRELEEAFCE